MSIFISMAINLYELAEPANMTDRFVFC